MRRGGGQGGPSWGGNRQRRGPKSGPREDRYQGPRPQHSSGEGAQQARGTDTARPDRLVDTSSNTASAHGPQTYGNSGARGRSEVSTGAPHRSSSSKPSETISAPHSSSTTTHTCTSARVPRPVGVAKAPPSDNSGWGQGSRARDHSGSSHGSKARGGDGTTSQGSAGGGERRHNIGNGQSDGRPRGSAGWQMADMRDTLSKGGAQGRSSTGSARGPQTHVDFGVGGRSETSTTSSATASRTTAAPHAPPSTTQNSNSTRVSQLCSAPKAPSSDQSRWGESSRGVDHSVMSHGSRARGHRDAMTSPGSTREEVRGFDGGKGRQSDIRSRGTAGWQMTDVLEVPKGHARQKSYDRPVRDMTARGRGSSAAGRGSDARSRPGTQRHSEERDRSQRQRDRGDTRRDSKKHDKRTSDGSGHGAQQEHDAEDVQTERPVGGREPMKSKKLDHESASNDSKSPFATSSSISMDSATEKADLNTNNATLDSPPELGRPSDEPCDAPTVDERDDLGCLITSAPMASSSSPVLFSKWQVLYRDEEESLVTPASSPRNSISSDGGGDGSDAGTRYISEVPLAALDSVSSPRLHLELDAPMVEHEVTANSLHASSALPIIASTEALVESRTASLTPPGPTVGSTSFEHANNSEVISPSHVPSLHSSSPTPATHLALMVQGSGPALIGPEEGDSPMRKATAARTGEQVVEERGPSPVIDISITDAVASGKETPGQSPKPSLPDLQGHEVQLSETELGPRCGQASGLSHADGVCMQNDAKLGGQHISEQANEMVNDDEASTPADHVSQPRVEADKQIAAVEDEQWKSPAKAPQLFVATPPHNGDVSIYPSGHKDSQACCGTPALESKDSSPSAPITTAPTSYEPDAVDTLNRSLPEVRKDDGACLHNGNPVVLEVMEEGGADSKLWFDDAELKETEGMHIAEGTPALPLEHVEAPPTPRLTSINNDAAGGGTNEEAPEVVEGPFPNNASALPPSAPTTVNEFSFGIVGQRGAPVEMCETPVRPLTSELTTVGHVNFRQSSLTKPEEQQMISKPVVSPFNELFEAATAGQAVSGASPEQTEGLTAATFGYLSEPTAVEAAVKETQAAMATVHTPLVPIAASAEPVELTRSLALGSVVGSAGAVDCAPVDEAGSGGALQVLVECQEVQRDIVRGVDPRHVAQSEGVNANAMSVSSSADAMAISSATDSTPGTACPAQGIEAQAPVALPDEPSASESPTSCGYEDAIISEGPVNEGRMVECAFQVAGLASPQWAGPLFTAASTCKHVDGTDASVQPLHISSHAWTKHERIPLVLPTENSVYRQERDNEQSIVGSLTIPDVDGQSDALLMSSSGESKTWAPEPQSPIASLTTFADLQGPALSQVGLAGAPAGGDASCATHVEGSTVISVSNSVRSSPMVDMLAITSPPSVVSEDRPLNAGVQSVGDAVDQQVGDVTVLAKVSLDSPHGSTSATPVFRDCAADMHVHTPETSLVPTVDGVAVVREMVVARTSSVEILLESDISSIIGKALSDVFGCETSPQQAAGAPHDDMQPLEMTTVASISSPETMTTPREETRVSTVAAEAPAIESLQQPQLDVTASGPIFKVARQTEYVTEVPELSINKAPATGLTRSILDAPRLFASSSASPRASSAVNRAANHEDDDKSVDLEEELGAMGHLSLLQQCLAGIPASIDGGEATKAVVIADGEAERTASPRSGPLPRPTLIVHPPSPGDIASISELSVSPSLQRPTGATPLRELSSSPSSPTGRFPPPLTASLPEDARMAEQSEVNPHESLHKRVCAAQDLRVVTGPLGALRGEEKVEETVERGSQHRHVLTGYTDELELLLSHPSLFEPYGFNAEAARALFAGDPQSFDMVNTSPLTVDEQLQLPVDCTTCCLPWTSLFNTNSGAVATHKSKEDNDSAATKPRRTLLERAVHKFNKRLSAASHRATRGAEAMLDRATRGAETMVDMAERGASMAISRAHAAGQALTAAREAFKEAAAEMARRPSDNDPRHWNFLPPHMVQEQPKTMAITRYEPKTKAFASASRRGGSTRRVSSPGQKQTERSANKTSRRDTEHAPSLTRREPPTTEREPDGVIYLPHQELPFLAIFRPYVPTDGEDVQLADAAVPSLSSQAQQTTMAKRRPAGTHARRSSIVSDLTDVERGGLTCALRRHSSAEISYILIGTSGPSRGSTRGRSISSDTRSRSTSRDTTTGRGVDKDTYTQPTRRSASSSIHSAGDVKTSQKQCEQAGPDRKRARDNKHVNRPNRHEPVASTHRRQSTASTAQPAYADVDNDRRQRHRGTQSTLSHVNTKCNSPMRAVEEVTPSSVSSKRPLSQTLYSNKNKKKRPLSIDTQLPSNCDTAAVKTVKTSSEFWEKSRGMAAPVMPQGGVRGVGSAFRHDRKPKPSAHLTWAPTAHTLTSVSNHQ